MLSFSLQLQLQLKSSREGYSNNITNTVTGFAPLPANTASSAGGVERFTNTGHGTGENGGVSIQAACPLLPLTQASASSRWSQWVSSRCSRSCGAGGREGLGIPTRPLRLEQVIVMEISEEIMAQAAGAHLRAQGAHSGGHRGTEN